MTMYQGELNYNIFYGIFLGNNSFLGYSLLSQEIAVRGFAAHRYFLTKEI